MLDDLWEKDEVYSDVFQQYLEKAVRDTGARMLYAKDGRLKPMANVIYSKAMKRMATDAPEDIVRDLESQIKLLIK